MIWATSFPPLLKLTQTEKKLKPDAMTTYKRRATIGSHITNYKTLAHRNAVTTETGSSAPCGHCALC